MDKQYFMNLSGSDFLILGILFGSFFHTFTTITLLFIFLVTTNRKIAGVETWTYLHLLYRFLSNFLSSSFGKTPTHQAEHSNSNAEKPPEKKRAKRKTAEPKEKPIPSSELTIPIFPHIPETTNLVS